MNSGDVADSNFVLKWQFRTNQVPPPIDFAYKFDGKQCLHIKMRLSLTLGDSEFLINQNSITGNCSEVTIGWPEPPFPLLGHINLKFNMEKNAEGVEHAGLRYLEVVVQDWLKLKTGLN